MLGALTFWALLIWTPILEQCVMSIQFGFAWELFSFEACFDFERHVNLLESPRQVPTTPSNSDVNSMCSTSAALSPSVERWQHHSCNSALKTPLEFALESRGKVGNFTRSPARNTGNNNSCQSR